jgi:hypothetical protein
VLEDESIPANIALFFEEKVAGHAVDVEQGQRGRVKQLVAKVVDGTGLQVRELTSGLVITNPRDPERGQVHVAFADGYVCWERFTWDFWGTMLDSLLSNTFTAP